VSCSDTRELAALLDGQLSEERAADLRLHLEGCAPCRERLTHLGQLTSGVASLGAAEPGPAFSAGVLGRLDGPRSGGAPRWRVLAAATVAIFALASVAVLALRGSSQPPVEPPIMAARGEAATATTAVMGVEVRAHVEGRGGGRTLRDGDPIPVGAGFSFVVRNHSGKASSLLLFAVDSAHTAHWFYPAYRSPAEDPVGVVVPAWPPVRGLPEGVTPEGLAAGPLTVVAAFCPQARRVREVERQLARGGVPALAGHLKSCTVDTLGLEARAVEVSP